MPKELTKADAAHLTFLRQQVDRLEHLRYTREASYSLHHQLDTARAELREFVEDRRSHGFNL